MLHIFRTRSRLCIHIGKLQPECLSILAKTTRHFTQNIETFYSKQRNILKKQRDFIFETSKKTTFSSNYTEEKESKNKPIQL